MRDVLVGVVGVSNQHEMKMRKRLFVSDDEVLEALLGAQAPHREDVAAWRQAEAREHLARSAAPQSTGAVRNVTGRAMVPFQDVLGARLGNGDYGIRRSNAHPLAKTQEGACSGTPF